MNTPTRNVTILNTLSISTLRWYAARGQHRQFRTAVGFDINIKRETLLIAASNVGRATFTKREWGTHAESYDGCVLFNNFGGRSPAIEIGAVLDASGTKSLG